MNALFYISLLLSCCLYAFIRGGQPERIGVGLLLVAVFATAAVHSFGLWQFTGFDAGVFVVDTALFLCVVMLAVRAQRYWPLWWAAVKLNTLITHLLVLSPALAHWSYWLGNAVWSYPSPLLIAVGAWRHRRRVQQYGQDPDWTDPSHWQASRREQPGTSLDRGP